MKTRKASNYLNSVTHQNNSRDAMHPQQQAPVTMRLLTRLPELSSHFSPGPAPQIVS
jgi:hypothetical protein